VDYIVTRNHYAIDVIVSSRSCNFLARRLHLPSASLFKPVQIGDQCLACLFFIAAVPWVFCFDQKRMKFEILARFVIFPLYCIFRSDCASQVT
jgi:hypothetical protein